MIVVALDFETADQRADSACALGMARVRLEENGGAVESTFYRLIRPPRRRVHFTEIHGITWDMVKNCPTFGEIWPECAEFLQGANYLVAHNASFDRAVLQGCCKAAGLTPPFVPFLCTVKGARKGLQLPRNRLNDVCEHLGIDLHHHHAESDALASARIFLHLYAQGLDISAMRLKS